MNNSEHKVRLRESQQQIFARKFNQGVANFERMISHWKPKRNTSFRGYFQPVICNALKAFYYLDLALRRDLSERSEVWLMLSICSISASVLPMFCNTR